MRKKDKMINVLEDMVLESETKFHNITKISTDVIYQMDVETMTYDYVTPSSGKVLGYSPMEMMSLGFKEMSSMVHPDDRKKACEYFYRVTGNSLRKDKESRVEYRFKHKQTGYCWMSDTRSMILDEDNNRLAIIGIIRNISGRKKAENELKQQKKMLEISERNLKKYSRKILSVREEEKKKISHDLHDEVGAMAISLNYCLEIAKEEIKNNKNEIALKKIDKAKKDLKTTIENIKKIIVNLRPPALDEVGLFGALEDYFSKINELGKFKIEFIGRINEKKLGDNIKITIYRIVQESLDNIVKHTRAKNVKISLYSEGGKLRLIITDNGEGFDVAKLKEVNKIRIGILGMRERVELMRGEFNIESALGKGTKISIVLPI